MNPDELQALLAQLLGYQQSPLAQPTLPGSTGVPSAASVPVYPGAPGPSTVPPSAGSHAEVHGGRGENQGVGGESQNVRPGQVGRHPLRHLHAHILNLLLHGTKPITHRQHLTLRALRQNSVLPSRNPEQQGGAPREQRPRLPRNRAPRNFGPMG